MSDKSQYATPKKLATKELFLLDFAIHGNVTQACKAAGIDRRTLYRWKEQSDSFLMRYNLAFEEAKDNIKQEIYRRGHDGVEEPLLSQGQLVYEYEPILDKQGKQIKDEKGKPAWKRGRQMTVRKYSDTLLIFHAKMLMPEYREKQQVDVNTNTSSQDMQAIQAAIAQALTPYPDAKIALAEALVEMEKVRERH